MILGLKTTADFKKGIPSQVYYNHFAAIAMHIENDANRFALKPLPFYSNLSNRNAEFNFNKARQMFWNSWSTEHAFLFASQLDNHEYYKFSLQWGFPQAYYSVYLNMVAFLETQGTTSENHEKTIKIFGNAAKDGHYPTAICFCAMGLHENFTFHNLTHFTGFPADFNGLSKVDCIEKAHIQLARFLKSTREKNAEDKRDRLKKANDRNYQTKKGEFLKAFRKEHWDKIYSSIPVTSVFNLLYRLRIKANYRSIETFINADINFAAFHSKLATLVYYLNFLHEAYFAKAVGIVEYEKIVDGFPKDLITNTAQKRHSELILPLH